VRVLVVTVVHHPEDARILHRQIGTLLDEGVEVVYLAPTDRPSSLERPGLEVRPVPRAVGRRRIRALRVVGRLLEEESATVDLTVLHDPELTLLRHRISGPALWDVHEDLPAQVSDKAWIPGLLSGPARVLARRLERRAAGRFSLTLAEDSYRQRLGDHPVIRNTPEFPLDVTPWAGPGEADRVVYLGRASRGRGAEFLAEVASRLSPAIGMDVVGPVDDDVRSVLEASPATVHGFVPNPEALSIAGGARAGLALLDDLPNYRHSTPTKVLEYLAHGLPVITTPLPEARRIVEESGGGVVVPHGDADAVVDVVEALGDPDVRAPMVMSGRRWVADNANWSTDAGRMLQAYRTAAGL